MTKILTGKVIGLKMNKTAVIEIEQKTVHSLYQKILTRNKKLKAHFENLNIKLGDTVKIKEIKPVSKTKNWLIIK